MWNWPLEGAHGEELACLGRTEPAEETAAAAEETVPQVENEINTQLN
jgi:hypothetical protein